jgi:hypothetical protein
MFSNGNPIGVIRLYDIERRDLQYRQSLRYFPLNGSLIWEISNRSIYANQTFEGGVVYN